MGFEWGRDGSRRAKRLERQFAFKFLPHNVFEEEVLSEGDPESIERGRHFRDKIEVSYLVASSVRWLGREVGRGLFAEEDIEKGAYVGEYTGIVRRNDIRRYLEPLNNYCFKYPVDRFVIDATQGHLTRFINHSANPNLTPVYAFLEGHYHLIFIANQYISKGTQLTYDYGQNYWHLRGKPVFI